MDCKCLLNRLLKERISAKKTVLFGKTMNHYPRKHVRVRPSWMCQMGGGKSVSIHTPSSFVNIIL